MPTRREDSVPKSIFQELHPVQLVLKDPDETSEAFASRLQAERMKLAEHLAEVMRREQEARKIDSKNIFYANTRDTPILPPQSE